MTKEISISNVEKFSKRQMCIRDSSLTAYFRANPDALAVLNAYFENQ